MSEPSIPTRAPSSRTLLDTARRNAATALADAVADGGRTADLAELLVNAVRGYSLSGPTERRLARIIGALIDDVGDQLIDDATVLGYGYLEVETGDRVIDTAVRRLDPTTVVKVNR